MLPLEMVYAFDPVPPPPVDQGIEEESTPDHETSEVLHDSALHRCSTPAAPDLLPSGSALPFKVYKPHSNCALNLCPFVIYFPALAKL